MNQAYERAICRQEIKAAMQTAADIKAAGGTDDDAVREAVLTARAIRLQLERALNYRV